MGLLSWVLIGGLAGWAASHLVGGRGGIIYDIIVGIVGALLGGFIMNRFGDAGVTGWNLRSATKSLKTGTFSSPTPN
jgi:uncharacterized membrane protein YeaQ/YmgE (transglycosylase-associated protein family)